MKKLILMFLLFLQANLLGEDSNPEQESLVIYSGDAEYNGKEILLQGNAVIQHGLGKISAHRLTLMPPIDKKKNMRFALLRMEDDVVIELQGGEQLHCQQAQIDYVRLKGVFSGNRQQPNVIYIDKGSSVEGSKPNLPIIVQSPFIEAELVQEEREGKGVKTFIRQIRANQHVRIHYKDDYVATADQAIYQRLADHPNQRLAGQLALHVREQDFCQIANHNGDHVQAKAIFIDTLKAQLTCIQAQGVLGLFDIKQPRQQLHFSANCLIWDDPNQMLILQGCVQAQQDGLGEIKTEKEMRLYQHMIEGNKTLRAIFIPAESELKYKDEKKELTHRLVCHGPLTIDHEHLQVSLQSPQDSEGNVVPEKQVYFEDLFGDIYADQMHLDYERSQHAWVPVKLTMQGHVQMLNRFDGHVGESGSVLQYALADCIEYFPSSNEMLLKGSSSQRVLFYDKVNNIQMSAPALKVKQDAHSAKSSVQGIGDVRFTFIEPELNQLRTRFPTEDPLQRTTHE